MAVTVITAAARHDFEDARALIQRLEDALPPEASHLRGKLTTASRLLTEVQDAIRDTTGTL